MSVEEGDSCGSIYPPPIFENCKIRDTFMARDNEDKFRGFAYVEFDDKASFDSALQLNGAMFADRELNINPAQPRGDRRRGGGRGNSNRPGPSVGGGGFNTPSYQQGGQQYRHEHENRTIGNWGFSGANAGGRQPQQQRPRYGGVRSGQPMSAGGRSAPGASPQDVVPLPSAESSAERPKLKLMPRSKPTDGETPSKTAS